MITEVTVGAKQRRPPFLLMFSKLGGISVDSLLSDQSGLRSEDCGHGGRTSCRADGLV